MYISGPKSVCVYMHFNVKSKENFHLSYIKCDEEHLSSVKF